jgi:hypothetical protein
MFPLFAPDEPLHPLITDTWPVAHPFELALWLDGLATLGRAPAHLNGSFGDLAVTNLAPWVSRASA